MSARLLTLPTTSSPQSPPPHRISIPPLFSSPSRFSFDHNPIHFVSWSLVSYCISLLCWIPAFHQLYPILSSAGQQTTQSLLPLYTLAHHLPQSRVCCLCLELYSSSICVLLVFLLSISVIYRHSHGHEKISPPH